MDLNFNLSSFFLESEGGTKLQGVKTRVVSLNNEQKLKGNKSLVTPKVCSRKKQYDGQSKEIRIDDHIQSETKLYVLQWPATKYTLAGSLAGRKIWVDKMIYPGG